MTNKATALLVGIKRHRAFRLLKAYRTEGKLQVLEHHAAVARKLVLAVTHERQRDKSSGELGPRRELEAVTLAKRKRNGAELDVKEEKILGQVLDGHWYYRSKGLALDAMLCGRSFGSLLDIGAGSGIFSKRLLKGGAASAICIDPAYEEEHQELLNGKPIWFLRQIGSEKCDLILLMDVLEHVDDDVGLIRAALVGAAKHAYVLITVPAFQKLFSAHDLFLEHKRRYTLRQIEEVARAAGLEILSARYFFAFLLPIAAAIRLLKQHREPKSDLKEHPKSVNSILCWLHRLELLLFRFNRIGGLTVFCLARVP